MFDCDKDVSKHGEQHILQEYNNIIEELKRELETCKTEQIDIRSDLEALHVENRNSSDAVRECISHIHLEECNNEDVHNKIVMNLKERIAILQMEKDSAVQLWHVSMKAVDFLEQELKTCPIDEKNINFYEEQLKNVKYSYSEAIKALESKLFQSKENFMKQQSSWLTSKKTIEILNKEKQETMKKFQEFQQDAQQKDRNSQQIIRSLTEELSLAKVETQRINNLKLELEKKLSESRKFASNIMAKNEEMKCKMFEALDLIESAVKEKEIVLQREAQVVEQKTRLELQLASIMEGHAAKMQEEMTKLKNVHERNTKKYLSEIKELKSELREKITLLDRSQRESKLAEEELERIRRDSEGLLQKSTAKILNFEQILKHTDSQLDVNEMCKKQYCSEIQQLEEKIASLEGKLIASNEELKQIQQKNSMDVTDCNKLTDERTKSSIDRYVHLETQLHKATNDKEFLATELTSLQSAFEHEMQKRNYERHKLENRIHELEVNLRKTYYAAENKLDANISSIDVPLQHHANTTDKHVLDMHVKSVDDKWQPVLLEQLNKQQKTFDKKIRDMTQHVTVHQKLSRRWREEAKSLTTKFQIKSKELHGKIKSLQKENTELHKIVFIHQQQFTQYKQNGIYSYTQGSETR